MVTHKSILIVQKTSKKIMTAKTIKRLRLTAMALVWLAIFLGAIANIAWARAGHSILDSIDPSFSPLISTSSFGFKKVEIVVPTPDGKILVGGWFNSYNGVSISRLVRLNADGSFDPTFNTALEANSFSDHINSVALQSDGKILVGGKFTLANETTARTLVRVNADGSLDPTFAYNLPSAFEAEVKQILISPDDKIVLGGGPWTTPSGSKAIVRINSDGTFDFSFDSPVASGVNDIAWQNNKIIVARSSVGGGEVFRLNSDGSRDASFTSSTSPHSVLQVFVQPTGKLVVFQGNAPRLYRLNQDGGADATFQNSDAATTVAMQTDGKLIVAQNSFANTNVKRLTPDGAIDSSFALFAVSSSISFIAAQPDGKILLGDENTPVINPTTNNFLRLNANGSLDASFNSGTGFQLVEPGSVRTIVVQPDEKIVIGGKFDLVNNSNRPKIARLNFDGTIDDSFQIRTSGVNRFVQIFEIFDLARQPDGKIIVLGAFTYIANGKLQKNLARLNADGTLDAGFDLNISIVTADPLFDFGANKVKLLGNGKILVGVSRRNSDLPTNPVIPIRLNPDGSRDTSFNPVLFSNAEEVAIYDLFVQPDGKTVVGGRYNTATGGMTLSQSFLVRLNIDGSLDQSFQTADEARKTVRSLLALPNGKMLAAKTLSPANGEMLLESEVVRLNADGSLDSLFNDGAGARGKINVLLRLLNGDILVGGKFTSFNNQQRANLAVLNEDGSLDNTLFNFNQEVLCFTRDAQGRVLVGGVFNVVNTGGGNNINRTFLARLIDSSATLKLITRFDFDGDALADPGVFNVSNGVWSILLSRDNQTSNVQFGQADDVLVPANYDGDVRTDIAVYRPSLGVWYVQQSADGFVARRWGAAEDKPVPADYDGDGRADIAVWRPSNGVWYIIQSSNDQPKSTQFGQSGDVPLVDADFDGDGLADIAVFRPSNGVWYWLASDSNNLFQAVQFGQIGDIPIPADYNADGKTDLTVFRRTNGTWYQLLSTQGNDRTFAAFQFGSLVDTPTPADYDGDRQTDLAVRRSNIWYLQNSTAGFTSYQFGAPIEKPIEAAFLSDGFR